MGVSATNHDDFGKLVEPYRRELQAHCYRLMGSVHEAEDIVQESFLKAWRNRDTLQNSSALRAWLYKIATNACLDALKQHKQYKHRRQHRQPDKQGRTRFVPRTMGPVSTLDEPIPADVNEPIWLEPYPDDLLPATETDPETRLVASENITLAFITALHLLTPRQRAMLILSEVMDLPAREVAALLDTTVSSVKSALHRARATLDGHGYRPANIGIELLDADAQLRLADYVRAWEGADVHAMIALLREDATFSMPPIPSWYQGRETIRGLVTKTIFAGQAALRWRLLPTRANRQPAFGLYRITPAGDCHAAYGIQVLTLRDGLLADIITFRVPALFPYFGLPALITRSL